LLINKVSISFYIDIVDIRGRNCFFHHSILSGYSESFTIWALDGSLFQELCTQALVSTKVCLLSTEICNLYAGNSSVGGASSFVDENGTGVSVWYKDQFTTSELRTYTKLILFKEKSSLRFVVF